MSFFIVFLPTCFFVVVVFHRVRRHGGVINKNSLDTFYQMSFWKSRSLGADQVKLDSEVERLAFRHLQLFAVLRHQNTVLGVI